jgi:pyruvate/2-oxoglutarate dehydrogenase complex dihydrolipoamide dehydrogenase (E3) component
MIDYGLVPWVIYTDPEVAGIGLNENEAQKAGIDYRVISERFGGNDRAVADGRTEGFLKLLVSPKGKLLGCRIVGYKAGEILPEWIAAIAGRVKLSTISQMMHPYPGYAEISRRAAGAWYADRLFGDRTRKLLRLIFGFRGRGPTI